MLTAPSASHVNSHGSVHLCVVDEWVPAFVRDLTQETKVCLADGVLSYFHEERRRVEDGRVQERGEAGRQEHSCDSDTVSSGISQKISKLMSYGFSLGFIYRLL